MVNTTAWLTIEIVMYVRNYNAENDECTFS